MFGQIKRVTEDGCTVLEDIGVTAENVETDTGHLFVTEAEKSKWNGLPDRIAAIEQSFQDGCSKIAAAVTSMGVTTAANAAVSTIAANIKKIVTKIDGTATPDMVLAPGTFYTKDAKKKEVGTMPEHAAWTATVLPGHAVTVPEGHHNGRGKVTALGGTQKKYLEAWGQTTDSHARATDILDNSAGTITALRLVTLTLDNKKYVPDSGSGSQTPKGTLIIKNHSVGSTPDTLFTKEITNSASHGSSASSVVTADLGNQLIDVSQCTGIEVTLDLNIGYNIGVLKLDYYAQ